MRKFVTLLMLLALTQAMLSSAWAAGVCLEQQPASEEVNLLDAPAPEAPTNMDADHCGHLSSHLVADTVDELSPVVASLPPLQAPPPLYLASRTTAPLTPPPLA